MRSSSKIASVLSLDLDQQKAAELAASKIRTLGEWFVELTDAIKDAPLMKIIGQATDAAKEWSGTVKFLVSLLDQFTKERSPQVLGWTACTLAYRGTAEDILREFGPPRSHVLYASVVVQQRLQKLRLDDPEVMSGFSLAGASTHPFTRGADKALLIVLEAAGYDSLERRKVLRRIRSSFPGRLQDLLSGEYKERFGAFSEWLRLESEDGRLFEALVAHVSVQRAELEERPALGIEPFTIDQVYIESECGILPWKTIRDSQPGGNYTDPFSEGSAPREDLMGAVLRLIGDEDYDDCIVIQGSPGAGKSTFTKKLCVHLHDEGFLPVRIPLQHLRVDKEIFDGIQDVITRFGGRTAQPFNPNILREKVFTESAPTQGPDISPYVFIFDGWDEINLAADEGFQKRVERLLDSIRKAFFQQNRNIVRVVITGRPSQAIGRSNFLRDDTQVLTLRPIRPAQLRTYVAALSRALDNPTFAGDEIESWSLGDVRRYGDVLDQYEREFPGGLAEILDEDDLLQNRGQTLEVLGQPLLVHLAFKVMANFKGDLESLIRPSTTLYRHLTDLTCKRGGRAPTEASPAGQTGRIEGRDLRSLLHGTALAITAYGRESIPMDELEFRLETLGVGGDVFLLSKKHPLSNLMISFYFKEAAEHSGCEFLHKSFREYLAAEAIVEALKGYGRQNTQPLAERELYWADFSRDDPRYLFSRMLGEIFCAQWISREISAHVFALLRWEIERAASTESRPEARSSGIMTDSFGIEVWDAVRDGINDLWDWWGEGVHLRPQPISRKRDWTYEEPPFVVELTRLAMRRANYGQARPPRPARTATIDAHLGCALFRLNCILHGLISESTGWTEATSQLGAEKIWETVTSRRRYQVEVKIGTRTFVQFAPSGDEPVYFRNYVGRITSAGVDSRVTPGGNEFPSGEYMRGVYLRGGFLFGLDFAHADLSSSMLRGAVLSHIWGINANLRQADLRQATLLGASLENADLHAANLDEAVFDRAGGVKLTEQQSGA